MITHQNLNSAVKSKEAGGYDNKVYDSLLQEYDETMFPGHRAMRKSFSKNEVCL